MAELDKKLRSKRQSLFGLNSINFFQAEMVGVVLPALGVLLKEHGWRYDSIGIAAAAAGLGTLLFQTPAGIVTDHVVSRRSLFAAVALATGIGLATIPLLPGSRMFVDTGLFLSGAAQSFFPPLFVKRNCWQNGCICQVKKKNRMKQLGGSDTLMTATVLTAQLVMVPVALLAGHFGEGWGRKPVMAIAFWILPLRIFSYTLVNNPRMLVWLQSLDGIGAGIYGVVVIALAADLTKGKGHFNTLAGLFATALAVGGVVGPLASGALVQHLGFKVTFYAFAGLAFLGAIVFSIFVPETKTKDHSLQHTAQAPAVFE